MTVAIVHDYLTQRGGAERVVLALNRTFPTSLIHTSLYDPEGTFPEFLAARIETLPINRSATLRRHHRLAFPMLAASFSKLRIDADVTICSSSGWAHGARVSGRKIVYCHAPARWLYQSERYLGERSSPLASSAVRLARRPLLNWDRRAAGSADLYLANSTRTRDAIREAYEIDAEVVPPPHAMDADAPLDSDPNFEPAFVLCVSRLLPYKNVDAVVEAFRSLEQHRLVVVGTGPEEDRLRTAAPANVTFAGSVSDARLRWLYSEATAVVAASYEDFGLTPLEGAAFGTPTAALRFGGFLDTIVEGKTGVFFAEPNPALIAAAIVELQASELSPDTVRAHAATFSEEHFVNRIREIVAQVTT